MSDIDILIREKHDIPEDEDTVEWLRKHGLDYGEEAEKVGAYEISPWFKPGTRVQLVRFNPLTWSFEKSKEVTVR